MANYDASIRVSTKIDTSQMQKLQIQIDKAADKVSTLSAKLEELKTKKVPTEEYREIEVQISKAEAKFSKLLEKQDAMIALGKNSGTAWNGLQYKIEEVSNEIHYAKGELKDLVDNGKAFTLGSQENVPNLTRDLSMAEAELRALNTKQQELTSGFRTAANSGKRFFSNIEKGAKKSSGLLSTMGARLKGLALSLLVFNWISKAFRALVNTMKEGFKNLAQYSKEYNKEMSKLKSQSAQTKNSLAAAFEPIVNIAIPYLTKLISILNEATNVLGQFLSAISGKSTYTRGKKQVIDYAKSLQAATKTAKGALAAFDELNVLSKESSGSDGGGELTGAEAFEDVKINPAILDTIEKLKNALSPLVTWFKEEVLPPLKELAKTVWEVIQEMWQYIEPFVVWLWEKFVKPLIKWIGSEIPKVIKFLSDTIRDLWNKIINPFLDWLIAYVIPVIQPIIDAIIESVQFLFDMLSEILGWIIKLVGDCIDFIGDLIAGDWSGAWDAAVNILRDVWGIIESILRFQMNLVKSIITGILKTLQNVWNLIWSKLPDPVKKTLTAVWENVKKVFNKILGGMESFINKIIDMINFLISKLNLLSFDVPDFFGGGTVGFNIAPLSQVNLPKLANGTVLRGGNPYMAIVNDQPLGQTNIEAPLKTIEQALQNVYKNNSGSGDINLTINLDGGQVYKSVVKRDRMHQESTGQSAFVF